MFTSCEIIKSKYLENGIAKVPYNNKVFKRKNRNLSSEIDANFLYKKVNYYMADKNYKKLRDIGKDVERSIQFYKNGRVRFFSFGYTDPNPEITGRRGIIYKKNGKIKIDTQFANQSGDIFKGTYSVKIEGDYLFLLDDNFLVPRDEYICFVYKKSDERIPEEWNKYKADWQLLVIFQVCCFYYK
jgi:hypothetical protein